MLRLDNISFRYFRGTAPVINGVDLTLSPGHIYGLLGRNGAGKSTLLYIMSGLLHPDGGKVSLDGEDVSRRLPSTLSDIFLVPEEFDLPSTRLKTFVKLNAPFYPRFSEAVLAKCLDDFELDRDLHLGRLSMGQKKRVFMSFALATQTRLILLDEPTNGLDIPAKSLFRKTVARNLAEDAAMVVSTHQVRDIDVLLDHIIMTDKGKIVFDHAVSEISERLAFADIPISDTTLCPLFEQPSIHGRSVVTENRSGHETPLNLELLFNAILAKGDILAGKEEGANQNTSKQD